MSFFPFLAFLYFLLSLFCLLPFCPLALPTLGRRTVHFLDSIGAYVSTMVFSSGEGLDEERFLPIEGSGSPLDHRFIP